LKEILSDWHEWLPLAGIAVVAIVSALFWLRRKPESMDRERERCAYLNRVGRIVEGQIIEVADHAPQAAEAGGSRIFSKRAEVSSNGNGTRKLLHYSYSISGVTYETAQDVTGLEIRAQLNRVAAGQTASVKYDPANPSNSILVADDWSGLH
jgi:hypothetical protein